jgi:glycosyltransferase involved in cell wall biosynthesis
MNAPPESGSVSVILPMFNAAPFVGAALDSIRAQSLRPSEVIVVDDGSTDGSGAIVARRGDAKLVAKAHSGAAGTLNHGVAAAQCEYLAFLDADDLWAPEKIALQVSALRAAGPGAMCFGHARHFHSPELTAEERLKIECPAEPLAGIVLGTLLIRRKDFRSIGPISTQWKVGYFVDWYARAKEAGLKTVLLPEVLLERRLHRGNLSRREHQSRRDFANILKLTLERRRLAAKAGLP